MSANVFPALPLTGGCPCGAIRYQLVSAPLAVYACHCTNCQRESGAAFALNMPVATASFMLTRGAAKGWSRISPSGANTCSWFCADCGGRIYGSRESRPERVNVRAGTLDDTSWLRPAAHLYMRSAQPWEAFSSEAECFDTMPADFSDILVRWRTLSGGPGGG